MKTGLEQILNALVDFLHSKKHNGDKDQVECLCNVERIGDVIANENSLNNRGSVIQPEIEQVSGIGGTTTDGESNADTDDKKVTEEIVDEEKIDNRDSSNRMTEEVIDEEVAKTVKDKEDKERLHKMGLNTAIAIGLHNFPEGDYQQTMCINSQRCYSTSNLILFPRYSPRACYLRGRATGPQGWCRSRGCHCYSQHPRR